MYTETTTTLCYGKLPLHADFVRLNTGGQAIQELDEWLQKGLLITQQRLADKTLYDSAPTFNFVFYPVRGSQILIGSLKTSHDQSGRRYPIIIASEQDKSLSSGSDQVCRLPLVHRELFVQFGSLITRATSGDLDHKTLIQHLERIQVNPASQSGSDQLNQCLSQASFKALMEQTWDHFEDSRKYILFKNLLDALLPVRGTENTRFGYGLLFPLPTGPDVSCAVSFWLKLVYKILAGARISPSLFWTTRENHRNELFMFLQQPPPGSFIGFLSPNHRNDIFDLDDSTGPTAAEAALGIPERYAIWLESENISLKALIDTF